MKTWQIVNNFKLAWEELNSDPEPMDDIEIDAYINEAKAGYLEAEGFDDDDYRVARMK